MISRRVFTTSTLAAAATLITPHAFAHRERTTLTEIEWEDNPGYLYVTHSFHIHEAERTLYKAGVIDKPDLYLLKTRAQLALYTAENFRLLGGDGQEIALEILGAEASGGDCFVYQQAELDGPPNALTIGCNLMREFADDQINNVDVKLTRPVRSLSFRGNDGPKKISLS